MIVTLYYYNIIMISLYPIIAVMFVMAIRFAPKLPLYFSECVLTMYIVNDNDNTGGGGEEVGGILSC